MTASSLFSTSLNRLYLVYVLGDIAIGRFPALSARHISATRRFHLLRLDLRGGHLGLLARV
jgi:hypothetical protein